MIIAEKRFNNVDIPTAANIQAIGARVSIRRTMTPAKYHASVPYNMTNMAASVGLENRNANPRGDNGTNTCKSKKKDVHVVGWCSDTLAMIGMYLDA